MKTLKCDRCDFEAQGETFEEWMNNLKPHYAEVHKDFMREQSEKPREDQMEEMQKWMVDNQARFDSV